MIPQSAVTIVAEVVPVQEAALRQHLESAGRDQQSALADAFRRLPQVHFARFFVLDATRDLDGQLLPPRLVFLADVDGAAASFLTALVDVAAGALDEVFAFCTGYPGRAALLPYLQRWSVPAAAMYVNTRGRTVQQVRQEAMLHDAIEGFLDHSPVLRQHASAVDIRAGIQQFVNAEPPLAWARQPLPPPGLRYALGEAAHVLGTVALATGLAPVVLAGLPIWLYLLRRHERSDPAEDVAPADAVVDMLAAQEDFGVQTPFTSAGLLKPGPFRRFTASLVLWGTDFLTRHVFNHGSLIGVKTIHFARWIFLDNKRRVIFASNYDGSLESYMDDFVDKIAWGLNAAFSNGVNFPPTNWLILDGAHDEQRFKRFNLTHQMVASFWYAGYQGLTALNIENNARIRAGLYGPMDESAARAWLRLL